TGDTGVDRPLLDIENTYSEWLSSVAKPLVAGQNPPHGSRLAARGEILVRRMHSDNSQALRILDATATSNMELTRQRLTFGAGLSVLIGLGLYAVILTILRIQTRNARQLDRFLATTQDIIGVARMDGYFIKLNPAANLILGY